MVSFARAEHEAVVIPQENAIELPDNYMDRMSRRVYGKHFAFTMPLQADFKGETRWYSCVTAVLDNSTIVKAWVVTMYKDGTIAYPVWRSRWQFKEFCMPYEWHVKE
jgi:hypothetical protein